MLTAELELHAAWLCSQTQHAQTCNEGFWSTLELTLWSGSACLGLDQWMPAVRHR